MHITPRLEFRKFLAWATLCGSFIEKVSWRLVLLDFIHRHRENEVRSSYLKYIAILAGLAEIQQGIPSPLWPDGHTGGFSENFYRIGKDELKPDLQNLF